jgi:hypothetical protein
MSSQMATNGGGGTGAQPGAAAAQAATAAANAAAAATCRIAAAATAATITTTTSGTPAEPHKTVVELNSGCWTHSPMMFFSREWTGPRKRWFDAARRKYKRDHNEEWKQELIRRVREKIEELEKE